MKNVTEVNVTKMAPIFVGLIHPMTAICCSTSFLLTVIELVYISFFSLSLFLKWIRLIMTCFDCDSTLLIDTWVYALCIYDTRPDLFKSVLQIRVLLKNNNLVWCHCHYSHTIVIGSGIVYASCLSRMRVKESMTFPCCSSETCSMRKCVSFITFKRVYP